LSTKQFLKRASHLDAVNIQTKHITHVACSFLAATVSVNIISTFAMSRICLAKDDEPVVCAVRLERARRWLISLPLYFGDVMIQRVIIPMRKRSKPTWRNALGSYMIQILPTTRALFKLIKQDFPS
jgi:hypothetical protein